MIHPVRELHADPLTAGVLYSTIIESIGVLILIPGTSIWKLLPAGFFVIAGIALMIWSILQFSHQPEES